MGESVSDFLVHLLGPIPSVLLGFVAFCFALARQLHVRRYRPGNYWGAVAMVGVFGTMAADVLHVGFHVPYLISVLFFGLALSGIFWLWQRSEGTLSMHSVLTVRRELFYWATVVATFALGTAAGDFTAFSLHLGYFVSIIFFGAAIMVPAFGYRFVHWNPIFSFWFAYVLTRPLGASVADALGKSKISGGLGIGSGWVALVLSLTIIAIVSLLAGRDAAAASTPLHRQHSAAARRGHLHHEHGIGELFRSGLSPESDA